MSESNVAFTMLATDHAGPVLDRIRLSAIELAERLPAVDTEDAGE